MQIEMEEKILTRLERIERYSIIAAKSMLTVDELSFITGLSKSWIYKATYEHLIPYYKPNGKQIYFDRAEIEAWMRQNRIATTEEANQAATKYILNNTGTNGFKKGGKK
jgi:excisionase family DNA binding protein